MYACMHVCILKILVANLKRIALGVNPFVSKGEPRLNVPYILKRSLNMHFPAKIRQILPPWALCLYQTWLTLTLQLFRYRY